MAFRRPTFNQVVLFLGLALAVAVAFGPILRECVARYTWQELPCYQFPGKSNYMFEYGGKIWIAGRQNLWFAPKNDAVWAASRELPEAPNGVCYVNGGEPLIAVKAFDAYRRLDQGAGNFVAAGVVVAVTVGLVVMSSRKKPQPARRPASSAT
jgi:hypothetical protein